MNKKEKYITFNSTSIFKALFTTIILFILRTIGLSIFQLITHNDTLSNVIVFSIIIIVLFIIEKKELSSQFKSIPKDVKKMKLKVPLTIILLLIIEYVANAIIMKHLNLMPTGQDMIEQSIKHSDFLLLFHMIITGPILEALFFFYPYKNIKNKKFAFIFSSVIFALFHMIAINTAIELLFLIPYICMSMAFSYGFFKTNNIYMSIIVHIINNALAIMLLLI